MIGKRNTGKSFLIKDLLYYNNHFQLGTVISGTESANHFYGSMIPKMFIHDEYKPKIIDNVVKRQKHVLKKISKEESTYGNSGVDPKSRTNIDYVFILRENIVANRKRIYDNYAGMFPTFEVFCQVMDQCTENYECLVINNTTKSNKLEDNVFWYKAPTHPSFKICSQSFWDISNNIEETDPEEAYDSNSFAAKRKHVINVKKVHNK
jgi:hypothetical protein